jgi:hypothetical protein
MDARNGGDAMRTDMNKEQFAAQLDGREYGNEITKDEEAQAKAAGLVVVFGYSDDNVELRGAIYDEVGAYDGTTIRVCREGLLPYWPEDGGDQWSEQQAEEYFLKKHAGFQEIKAVWCPSDLPGTSWRYQTAIPNATFKVMEDGEIYCQGIVFALSDVKPTKD